MGFEGVMGEIVDIWADTLIQRLGAGRTIRQAMLEADTLTANYWGSEENLKSRTVRGNDLNTVLF